MTARAWQAECLPILHTAFGRKPDALVSATPGAGKTWLAMSFARDLLSSGQIDRVHVVSPTVLITRSWRETAERLGVHLVTDSNARLSAAADTATTYAQIGQDPIRHAKLVDAVRTLAITDELHHAGDDRSWGDSLETALAPARFRLHLSGTPFRHDACRIPFVAYDENGASIADYSYGYSRAVSEGVCRPISFHPFDLAVRFRSAVSEDEAARVFRLSLRPECDLIERMVREADAELTERRQRWPDAAGLLVAMTQEHARICARMIRGITGQSPVIVISDSPNAEDDLALFRAGHDRWIVSVKMLSEGVDVPRLMVAVYATNIVTTLFFRQFIGRVVRVRDPDDEETASIYMPRDDRLIREASNIESEVRAAMEDSGGRFKRLGDRLANETELLTSAETFRPRSPPTDHGFQYTTNYRPLYR